MNEIAKKTLLIVSIELILALLHVLPLGSYLEAPLDTFYSNWFSDFVLPFGFYFLLCLNDMSIRLLKPWYVKALLVFTLAAAAEFLQKAGVYALGETFDWYDLLMYFWGVLLAAFTERHFLAKFPFWDKAQKHKLN